MASSIDPRIFRAYDIRGKAFEQLTPEACRLIGKAFGTELRQRYGIDEPKVAVGRDARTHGPQLEAELIAGLKEAGCHVVAIGATPSPVNYFAVCRQELDGGAQLTASHNPPADNGIKLCIRNAEAFSGDDLQNLRRRITDERFVTGKGKETALDAATLYAEYVTGLFADAGLGRIVALDAGNGIAGPVACRVLRATGATVEELYTEPDGNFPNHPADPSKHETLKDLQKTVRDTKADVGFAFDGDGDRLGLVDETGTIRSADEVLLLLAKDHLQRNPGATVIFTVSNSGILDTEVRSLGGKPVMCKVGHSFVEHAMLEHKALLGGEQSGHFFCAEEYFPFDDALVAALRVLRIMESSGKPLSTLFSAFPKVFQAPERRPYCHDDEKAAVIKAVTAHYEKTHSVVTLDGARIDFGDGAWAGIRQSNTSPCISICIEARSPERLKRLEDEILAHLRTYPQLQW